jgi:hypothetical protein
MIISVLIASAVIGLLLVLLVQGKWTSMDSWFVAVFASAVMAMVIGQYVDLMRLSELGEDDGLNIRNLDKVSKDRLGWN